jgi:hypothetical protein
MMKDKMGGMPSQANKGGAMRGQARAAAMSGRGYADGGKVFKTKQISMRPGVCFHKSSK